MTIRFPFRARARVGDGPARVYLVVYDIASPKRWRLVYRTLLGQGEWLQLSVFRCRLTSDRKAALVARLAEIIVGKEDHVLFFDLGSGTDAGRPDISLGRPPEPMPEGPVIA